MKTTIRISKKIMKVFFCLCMTCLLMNFSNTQASEQLKPSKQNEKTSFQTFALVPTLECENVTYGEKLQPHIANNLSNGDIHYAYKVQGSDDSTYTSDLPNNAGDYTIQATIEKDPFYEESILTKDVTIERAIPVIDFTISPTNQTLLNETVHMSVKVNGINDTDIPTGNVLFKENTNLISTHYLNYGLADISWLPTAYGYYDFEVSYEGDNNYTSANTSIPKYEITKKTQDPLIIHGATNTMTFGDAPLTLSTSGGSGSGEVTFALLTGDTLSINGNKLSVIKPGVSTIIATKEGDDTYNEITSELTINVDKATPAISVALDPANGCAVSDPLTFKTNVSGIQNQTPTGSIDVKADGVVGYSSLLSNGKNLSQLSNLSIGIHTFTIEYNGDDYYYSTSKEITSYPIIKKDQQPLSIVGLQKELMYKHQEITLNTNGGSGSGNITYSADKNGVVDIQNNKLTVLKPGTTTIYATKYGDETYNASNCSFSITIYKATPNIDFKVIPASGSYANEELTLEAKLTGVTSQEFPTGMIIFKSNNQELGRVVLVNGVAKYTYNNVRQGTYNLSATYIGDTHYQAISSDIDNYHVSMHPTKKQQAPLTIKNIKTTLTYGDSMQLEANGGSGNGAITYAVQSGDAIKIQDNQLHAIKCGSSVIEVNKAEDETYQAIKSTYRINVKAATPKIEGKLKLQNVVVGTTLSELPLENLVAYNLDSSLCSGNYAWENPQTIVNKDGNYNLIFYPNNQNYKMVPLTAAIALDHTLPKIQSIEATPDINFATLKVAAKDANKLDYQWQVFEDQFVNIPNATSDTFHYTNLKANHDYQLRVIIRDVNNNTITSDPVSFHTLKQVIKDLPTKQEVNKGGTFTLTPKPKGGSWDYDAKYISMHEENGVYTFKGLTSGTTTITYTINNTSYDIQLSILDAKTPKTNDNTHQETWIFLLTISLLSIGVLSFRKITYKKQS